MLPSAGMIRIRFEGYLSGPPTGEIGVPPPARLDRLEILIFGDVAGEGKVRAGLRGLPELSRCRSR